MNSEFLNLYTDYYSSRGFNVSSRDFPQKKFAASSSLIPWHCLAGVGVPVPDTGLFLS